MKDSAYAFAAQVDRQIEEFSQEDYLKKSQRCKRLREEIYPISRLALFLKQPGCEVEVEAFENSGPVDGHITVRGFKPDSFDIEVTSTADYEEALRNELLVKRGCAPGFGKISRARKSRSIVADTQAYDDEELAMLLARSIVESYEAKTQKQYDTNTDLIVAFEEIKMRNRTAWHSLFEHIESLGGLSGGNFRSVYLLNCFTNEIYQAA
jgi:hypothetical protein